METLRELAERRNLLVGAACIPEIFELDEDELAGVKLDPIPAELEATCREAVDVCPADAISVVDTISAD